MIDDIMLAYMAYFSFSHYIILYIECHVAAEPLYMVARSE